MALQLIPPPDDAPDPSDAEPPQGHTVACTDLANAERLRDTTENLRYVGSWRKWLAWDGKRWGIDSDALAQYYAVEVARQLADEAQADVGAAMDAFKRDPKSDANRDALERAQKRFAWAAQSQSARRIDAMLHVARSFPALAAPHEQLDADPWVLNVQNGTLDLLRGKLLPHLRTELCTLVAGAAYDPDARCPTWDAFLQRVQPDAIMRCYLQRLAGYSAVGVASEQMLAFHWGGGGNGKSTFLSTLHSVLGDYACPAHPRLIYRSPSGDRHLTERASLFRRRFVTCSEASESLAFDESTLKDLTGDDPIRARRMREDEWTFRPSHTLHLYGNERPIVRATDNGFWRRMHLIPWAQSIPESERDTRFATRLLTERAGILRWIVDGCAEWQRVGLQPPEAVTAATQEYRRSSDVAAQFLQACCECRADLTVTKKSLREAFEGWCREQGYEPLGARRMAEALRRNGATETTVRVGLHVVHGWRGLSLLATA